MNLWLLFVVSLHLSKPDGWVMMFCSLDIDPILPRVQLFVFNAHHNPSCRLRLSQYMQNTFKHI